MSYHCSQALVEEFSALGCLDGEQSAELSGSRTAERSYFDDKKKGSSNRFPSGTTSAHSMGVLGVERWISSLPDSLANPLVLPAKDGPKRTTGICGLKPSESFARLGTDSAYWKTSQVCLFTNTPEPFSENWPKAGMIVNGIAYRRPPLAHHIADPDCGLWPTPRTITGGPESAKRKKELGRINSAGGDLQAAVKVWPTPRAGNPGSRPNKKGGKILAEEVKKMWPTPRKQMSHGVCKSRAENPALAEAEYRLEDVVAVRGGTSIPQTYPTPQAADCKQKPQPLRKKKDRQTRKETPGSYRGDLADHVGAQTKEDATADKPGQLNPDWVEWLMGWPIGWTDLKPLETDRFRKWLELHGSF